MTHRIFVDRQFELLGQVEPERDGQGALVEFLPQDRYKNAETTQLHAYGAGPFCRFRIVRGRKDAGLYVLTVDGTPAYAGECVNIGKRWGSSGYGGISPRNCFVGGQPTNCRVNAAVLQETRAGKTIELWFYAFAGTREERLGVETVLIQTLQPPWNRSKLR